MPEPVTMNLIQKFRSMFARKPARRASFRPRVEGLESRWCPSTYHWSAPAPAAWNTAGDWQVWNPANGGSWQNTNLTPTDPDTAQFDGTSTKLCTVTAFTTVAELDITVSGNGADQISVANAITLLGKMVWSVDGVQINFASNSSTLTAAGGSSIKSFTFDGAKGIFALPGGARAGTTTWSTGAASSTTAQIQIAGGILDVQSTGTCTSTYGGADVYVLLSGTLKFSGGTNFDLFDNNNDGNGYIFVNSGNVTTSSSDFVVDNKMPIDDKGSVAVSTSGTLGFFRSAAATDNGSYYMEGAGSKTILQNGATLLCWLGYEQVGGELNVADGSKVFLTSSAVGSSIEIKGGAITFPAGTTYGTLQFGLPNANSFVYFGGGTVTMKVDATTQNNWKGDQIITTVGYDDFALSGATSLVINSSGRGGALTGSWNLLNSALKKVNTWGSVTNNVAGTTAAWDGTDKLFELSK